MNLNSLQELILPEGKVTQIAKNGVIVWNSEKWDVEWICSTAVPPTATWERITDVGTISFKDTYGPSARMKCTDGTSNDKGPAIRLKDYTSRFGQKCVFEAEILLESVQTDSGGIRLILGGSNSSGAAAGKGIKVTINQNSTDGKTYMHVLQSTGVISTQRKTAEISLLEWHKIRLTLDMVAGSSTVKLDGKVIATQTNAQLSTMDTNNTWINAKNGTCYVRAIRYRKEA